MESPTGDRPGTTMHLTRPRPLFADEDNDGDDAELSALADRQAVETLTQDGFSSEDLSKTAWIKLDGHGRMSPTAFYSRTGNMEMLKYLEKDGALARDCKKIGSMGRSPMYQAIIGGHKEVARLLFRAGAVDRLSEAIELPSEGSSVLVDDMVVR